MHLYLRGFYLEFWELERHDGEIRIKRIRGVDGAVVSYPGAEGDEGRAKRCISARSKLAAFLRTEVHRGG